MDSFLKLALSAQTNPGVYALLLGSGLSRAAGIPTGWEVVLDLINRLAAVRGESPEPDPETWYHNKFGVAPAYDTLLDEITTTPSERMTLLRPFFEPNEDEREQGLKLPTVAHRMIAKLVKMGTIRMILTTNFDRLLEQSLQDEGIVPDIIYNDDSIKGAMPFAHSKCYVVKLHGDYIDTRIKNTPSELSSYSDLINSFLDRIFDEFGLIVIGWSGVWDTALRDAILRSPNRRFATFWLAKDPLAPLAIDIVNHRRAETITIADADSALSQLHANVVSLVELDSRHPMSLPVAISTVKRYMADSRNKIRLHDFISDEIEDLMRVLSTDEFNLTAAQPPRKLVEKWTRCLDVANRLIQISLLLNYHQSDELLLTRMIERLAQLQKRPTYKPTFCLYPALILLYVNGIVAIAFGRYNNLAALLLRPRYFDSSIYEPHSDILYHLNVYRVFDQFDPDDFPVKRARTRYAPISEYLFATVRPLVIEYLSDDNQYERYFDLFEYFLALVHLDSVENDDGRCPLGRFGWKWGAPLNKPFKAFIDEAYQQENNWPPLVAGFFGGSVERLRQIAEKHTAKVTESIEQWN